MAWRILRLTLILATTLALLISGTFVVFAWGAPFRPGDALFPTQDWAEQVRVSWLVDPAAQADVLLQLASQRVKDLDVRAGTDCELLALAYVNRALDQAVLAVAAAPPQAAGTFRTRLAGLAAELLVILERLSIVPITHPDVYRGALAKVGAVRDSATVAVATQSNADLSELAALEMSLPPDAFTAANAPPVAVPPHGVPFPPNSTPGAHDTFPLTGRHAALACGDCHTGGDYQGTPAECLACHGDDAPANHYGILCADCHSTSGWTPATFDHAGFTDCLACHTQHKPANHFEGQCSICHTTSAWLPANFDHTGYADCAACHTQARPSPHYDGQCSACHTTTAWLPANFDHTGYTDCLACHTQDRPSPHYDGQCSLCHSTSAWTGAVFNHSTIGTTDCVGCHAPPANHYAGACKNCHGDTSNWRNAVFDHSTIGTTDCLGCHAPPANHYAGACRDCHGDTSNWQNAVFNHSTIGTTDCATCHAPPANHFPGACRDCHTDTSNWQNATFTHTFPIDHHGAKGNCATCHPGNDYTAWTCTECHSSSKMDDKHKEITGYSTNCIACHADGKKPKD